MLQLHAVYQAQGAALSPEYVAFIIQFVDQDGDNMIDITEASFL